MSEMDFDMQVVVRQQHQGRRLGIAHIAFELGWVLERRRQRAVFDRQRGDVLAAGAE